MLEGKITWSELELGDLLLSENFNYLLVDVTESQSVFLCLQDGGFSYAGLSRTPVTGYTVVRKGGEVWSL